MLTYIKNCFKQQNRRKYLSALLTELENNLEKYYVMYQLNRLRVFDFTSLDQGGTDADLTADPLWQVYVARMKAYDVAVKDYQNYEIWYNADIDRKNSDNGRVLHAKKEAALEKFKGLEDVIKGAIQAIQKRLINKGT